MELNNFKLKSMPKPKKQKRIKPRQQQKEKPCKHQWAALMAQKGKKVIAVPSAKICLKCGLLKIGVQTIKISSFRLDMGDLPINNAKAVIINSDIDSRLKVPVGTDMYD